MSVPFEQMVNNTTFVKQKHKTPEELGLNVDTQGIYAMSEEPWVEAMVGEYVTTGNAMLQFGVGDSPLSTMRKRMSSLSSSKDLQEQKFFIDAIPNPGYRDHDLHPLIRASFAWQVSESKDKREVFKVLVAEAMVKQYMETGDFEPIREWLSEQIRKVAAKLNLTHEKRKVALRGIQLKALKKIVALVKRKGAAFNVVAELAPRLGKTILFLCVADALRKESTHEAMFVLAYGVGLSVKTSYKNEISKFQDFADMVFIDNADPDAEDQYIQALAESKFPVVFVSLNAKIGDGETEEKLDWIETRTEDCIALLEETDFGVHTDSQVEKTSRMFANKQVARINASGTNIGRIAKAFGESVIDEIIITPYSQVEQDESIPNVVKRRFYDMTFNPRLNNLLEDFDEDVLPNINKILSKAFTQEKFLTALFQDMFGYQPIYGLNLNDQAGELINHLMMFVNITKAAMDDLAVVIERACPEHKVLILNGDYTDNKNAEIETFSMLTALRNNKYPGRDKLIVITNMMGTRSYSVPEIQACLFMHEGGDIYPYMQKYSRVLTPDELGLKKYGHIFDFAFDTSKTRNTVMCLAADALAEMKDDPKLDYPSAMRKVLHSVGLKDMVSGKWLDVNDVISQFEDNDKLLEIANALSKLSVDDFDDNDFANLSKLASRGKGESSKSEPASDIDNTGKTFENQDKKPPVKETDEQKELKNKLALIKKAIKALNSSASTVAEFTDYQGRTYKECLDIISADPTLSAEFADLYLVTPEWVLSKLDKLPVAQLDMIIVNTIAGLSEKSVANGALGIVKDDVRMWEKILGTPEMRQKFNNILNGNPDSLFSSDKPIIDVAGGHGAEIDAMVNLFGIDIIDKIVYTEKYTPFCNRIKRKYPSLTIMHGDYIELDKKNMHFDIAVGNPPYQKPGSTQKDDSLWPKFLKHTISIADTVAFVTPLSWGSLGANPDDMGSSIAKQSFRPYHVPWIDLSISEFFKEGSTFSAYIIDTTRKPTGNADTKLVLADKTEHMINLADLKCIPTIFNNVVIDALDKTIYSTAPKFKVVSTDAAGPTLGERASMPGKIKDGHYSDTQDKAHPYRSYHTNAQTHLYSKFKNDFHNQWKVVFALSGSWYKGCEVTNECSLTDGSSCILVNNEDEAKALRSILQSKPVTKMIDEVLRWAGYYSFPVVNNIPELPLDHEYTDLEVLQAWGLDTPEQREFWL